MPRPPNVKPLPDRERRQSLAVFLDFLGRHPDLAHFRAAVPAGPERQLALFAALERATFRGHAAVCPPAGDDVADQLLCDILEAIDGDREMARHGSAYGADRQRANLQALGAWSGQPLALGLFATMFSHLNAGAARSLPAPATNCSPDPQESAPFGDLIGAEIAKNPGDLDPDGGIIRHGGDPPGEQSAGTLTTLQVGCDKAAAAAGTPSIDELQSGRGFEFPSRSVRRGRPPALDDQAKGRLLGLMSYGLSFRQAAAQLGVHHQTLLNALKRDEEFAQQVAEARLDAISQPLVVIVQAARKNWRAAAWLARFLNERRLSSYESTPEERELERKRG
jgi:hypothetical protein